MYEKEKVADVYVRKIREDPASIDEILEKVSDPSLMSMIRRKFITPGEVFANGKFKDKRIAYSYYKPRVEYNERYAMLAVVAFINRMLDEWGLSGQPIPALGSKTYMSENDDQFTKVFYEDLEKIKLEGKINKLQRQYSATAPDYSPEWFLNQQIEAETKLILNDITPIEYKTLQNRIKIHAKKHSVRLKKLVVEDYNPTEEDIENIRQHVKKVLGISKTREEKLRSLKRKIALFLDEHFAYNPDNHAFCKYKPKFDREFLSEVEQVNNNPNLSQEDKKEQINQLLNMYREDKETKYMRNLIPPEDTMVRFHRYEKAHHFELKQLTEEIYTDLVSNNPVENCIVFYDIIDDDQETIARFKQKYKHDFPANVETSKFGRWEYLADNEEILTNIDCQHKLLKRLNERGAMDRKIANSMLKARAKLTTPNLSKEDKEQLDGIMKKNMDSYNIPHANDIDKDDYIKAEDIPKDFEPAPEDMVEVGVIEIRPTFAGRFDDVKTTNKWQFHSVLSNQ